MEAKQVSAGHQVIKLYPYYANSEIKEALKEKMISEDESHKGEEKIQKLTDSYVKAVEKLLEEKEADLMSF